MSTLDLRPGVVDLLGYAGDTIRLDVRLENVALLEGRTFTAQVRATPDAATVLATWEVTPTLTGALVVLPSDVTADLFATTPEGQALAYDVQLADAATPPDVLTVVRGALTLTGDVTRVP